MPVTQAELILHVEAVAAHPVAGVAGKLHGAVVAGQGAGIVEIPGRDRGGVLVELGGAILPALLQADQQAMLDGAGLQQAFGLGVAGEAAGLEILLPAGAGHLVPLDAGDIGVVELAVEGGVAELLAQLPLIVQIPGEAGTGGLGQVVDEVAAGVAVDALDGDVGGAAVDAGDAAIWGAVVLVALVLHQPVQAVADLPVDGGGQQGALAGHVVAETLLVFLSQVEA